MIKWIKFSEREPDWGYPFPDADILICDVRRCRTILVDIFLYKNHCDVYKRRYTHWALVNLPEEE